MRAIQLKIGGNWAHFRKPETSNNPLSHDFITKTALIGLIGAVLGIERKEMKKLFPLLSKDLKYGVQVNNAVNKQSWGFTNRSVNDAFFKAPKQMEIIRNPDYTVIIGIENINSKDVFESFSIELQNDNSCYTPVLGLHNCPANLQYVSEGELQFEQEGEFETFGFITTQHNSKLISGKSFRLGFDKIPTFQNDDFWNLPEEYVSIVYPSQQNTIVANGSHYIFNQQSQWVMI